MHPRQFGALTVATVVVVAVSLALAVPTGVFAQQDAETQSFAVDDATAPDLVTPEADFTVTAVVSNPNDATSTQEVALRSGGVVLSRLSVTLPAGENVTVEYNVSATSLPLGTNFLGVYTQDEGEVTAVEVAESYAVESVSAPANVTAGDPVEVSAVVTNPNDFETTQRVDYRFDGDVVNDTDLTLAEGESAEVNFTFDTNDTEPGDYVHSVFTHSDGLVAEITVENATEPEPPTQNASVTFEDQNTTGESVVVANATLPEGGFIAVLNESGDVVGATEYLENGTSENVSVPFLTPLDENDSGTYTAQLHMDTNDNQELDFLTSNGTEDTPYLDEANEAVADDAEVTVEANVTEPEPENASVSFEDQNTTGESVTVANATLPEGGFIAVLNESGDVVGATDYLENGTSENVTVSLLTPLDENDSGVYTAQLHEDTNDNQELDFLTSNGTEDTPYLDENGTAVADSANVTVEADVTEPEPENASVTFEDQNTTGESVVVANATLPEGGFIAILNESGDVVGATEYLENGTSENVSVALLEPLDENDSGSYTAQLHMDTNDNQELDFLTSDGTEDTPYEDESGEAVADDAEVTVEAADGNETAALAPMRL
ncbi:hypothetical protein ACFO0N_04680 [Halobium salinum]|uniref:DUF7282 domain-containing protein n=1 Tax=Halobium salinum TaxID=1364940 RepID=A0ABD5P956_9EURY|nr:hypothetical protein [Halobium salinum]